jgi:hypothetical protein
MALQPLWALAAFQSPDLFTIDRTPSTSDQLVARSLLYFTFTFYYLVFLSTYSERVSFGMVLWFMHILLCYCDLRNLEH